jgi:hypothetical protein
MERRLSRLSALDGTVDWLQVRLTTAKDQRVLLPEREHCVTPTAEERAKDGREDFLHPRRKVQEQKQQKKRYFQDDFRQKELKIDWKNVVIRF